jgi:hypothetical protein
MVLFCKAKPNHAILLGNPSWNLTYSAIEGKKQGEFFSNCQLICLSEFEKMQR